MYIVSRLPSVVLAAYVFLPLFALCAAESWTLQTQEGGNVLFPAGDAKFQPLQRRADDSFKRYVANVEADSSDASKPRLRWTFPQRGEGERNVIVMTLDAERWSGGQCASDAKTLPIPKQHEKGKNIHIAGHEARTFCFKDPLGRSFRLDFGETVRLHAMDGREWNLDEFIFRFYCAGDEVTAVLDAGGPVSVSACDPFVIEAGEKWIPLAVSTDIKEGSALDFSGLGLHDAPAGKYGWLVSRNGHAEFEQRPGVAARFYGVNLCNDVNFPDHETAVEMAERFSRMGYNCVRLHHHDRMLTGGKGPEIDPEAAERMDYLVA